MISPGSCSARTPCSPSCAILYPPAPSQSRLRSAASASAAAARAHRRRLRHDAREHLQGRRIGMAGRGAVISEDHFLAFADAAQFDEALAILRRLDGVGLVQVARGRGIFPNVSATNWSVFASSRRPASTSTALSGW